MLLHTAARAALEHVLGSGHVPVIRIAGQAGPGVAVAVLRIINRIKWGKVAYLRPSKLEVL